jgi:pimeloyl-ACP methyl ester carboxylesterase
VVSWQHGTILSFDQVPSNLMRLADPNYTLQDNVDSLETLFNLHRLAAQGYVVIAADYLGKGPYRENQAEAYAVREATVQCCHDVLDAGMSMLKPLGIRSSSLLLNGWSQGAINTQWLGLELHRRGIRVDALAAESPFNNLPDSLRYWSGNLKFASSEAKPYPAVPAWMTPCLVILLGSYRAYYKLPDLFDTAIRPQHRAFAETYWHNYVLDTQMQHDMPTASEFFVEGFFERFIAQSNTNFLSHLARNSTIYTQFEFPVTFYYGSTDEALPPQLVQMELAAGGRLIQGVQVQGASHRVTFLSSLYGGDAMGNAKTVLEWFNGVCRSKRT